MHTSSPKLHFHRYEFKYLVEGDTLRAVLDALQKRMERDAHSAPNGSYFVRSVYFDTASFRYHQEKEAGLHSRYKFRIRSYAREWKAPVFLELKGKHDNLVFKHRQELDVEGLSRAMEQGISSLCGFLLQSRGCNGVGHRFAVDCFRERLSPSLVVDYRRTAFESAANPDFRATLDQEVTARKSGRNGEALGHSLDLSPRSSILEIKFLYHLPSWFHRLMQAYELRRVPFSKFHRAGEGLWMGHPRSLLDRRVERGRSWPL